MIGFSEVDRSNCHSVLDTESCCDHLGKTVKILNQVQDDKVKVQDDKYTKFLIFFAFIILLSGCDAFLPAKGDDGQPCTDGGLCLDGLVCYDKICVDPDSIDGDVDNIDILDSDSDFESNSDSDIESEIDGIDDDNNTTDGDKDTVTDGDMDSEQDDENVAEDGDVENQDQDEITLDGDVTDNSETTDIDLNDGDVSETDDTETAENDILESETSENADNETSEIEEDTSSTKNPILTGFAATSGVAASSNYKLRFNFAPQIIKVSGTNSQYRLNAKILMKTNR